MSKLNLESIIGQRFNALTVISQAKRNDRWEIRFNCKCVCGKKKVVRLYHLQKGLIKSCGCIRTKSGLIIENFIGQKFGRLIILGRGEKGPKGQAMVNVKCDCGVERSVLWTSVSRSTTKSCGCLGREWKEGRGTRASAMFAGKFTVPEGYSGLKMIFNVYKTDSKSKGPNKAGVPFELTLEDFYRLTQMDCHYCGIPPSNKRVSRRYSKTGTDEALRRQTYVYNGLDRVNSSKGYTLDNVVPCCKICNTAKNNMTPEKWQEWIDSFTEFQLSKRRLNALDPIKRLSGSANFIKNLDFLISNL